VSVLEGLVLRSRFGSVEDLVDCVVENRGVSLVKLGDLCGLSVFELRRLLGLLEFRRLASERLSLSVLSLVEEEAVLRRVLGDVLGEETRVADRVRGAEFLFRQGGVERVRESKVGVDHSVRVVFEQFGGASGGWRPPDPFVGVVGGASLGLSSGLGEVSLLGESGVGGVEVEEAVVEGVEG
jgi:hypothetical protein